MICDNMRQKFRKSSARTDQQVSSCILTKLRAHSSDTFEPSWPNRTDPVLVTPLCEAKLMIAVGTPVARCHRVAGGGHPPPAPTERSVRFSRTTLVRS